MKHVFALVFLTVGAAHAQQQSRFDQWDRNKDGKLTRDELPRGLQRNFDRVDADKDGFISREENAAFLKQRSAPRVPDGYEHIANINYAGGKNPRQGLDLILPKDRAKAEQPSPLLVFIHGGAWRNGSKEGGIRRLGDILVKTGFAGATINYRLSGEAQWPAQVHDCKAAIRWLRANSEKHGYDGDKIAVWGSSAGGHLVAMLGATGGVKEFEGDIGNHDATNSRVQAVVDYFGPSELLTMNDHESSIDHNASDSPESRLIGGAIQENKEKANNASPMTWVTKDDAPHLIVHGDRDMLVPFPQSKNYDARLDAAGVRSTLIHIEGGGHGQGFDTEKLTPLIVAFLGRNCSGKNARWKRRSSRHCHDAGSGSGIGDNSGGASRRPQPVGTFTSSATSACDASVTTPVAELVTNPVEQTVVHAPSELSQVPATSACDAKRRGSILTQ